MDNMNYNLPQDMEESKNRGFRFWFLIGAAIVLCVVLVIGAVVLLNSSLKQQKYVAAVNLGNNYYSAGDYQNAILQYQQAIEINDKEASSYLNMSSAYMNLGDYDSARNIILRGLELIDTEILHNRWIELQNTVIETKAPTVEEIKQLARNVMIENTIFDMVASYTYTEYYRDFGNPTTNYANNGQVELFYNAINLSAIYYDMENERVLNDEKTFPMANVKPCYVRFKTISSLFSGSEEQFAVSYEKLTELMGNGVTIVKDEAQSKYYVVAEYKGCKLTIETDAQGNVVSENAWNKVEPLSRKGLAVSEEVDGKVSGYVQDAVSGKGMAATIKVRKRGSRVGQALHEFSSAKDGSYTFAGEKGTYTLEVSANGYTTEYVDVEIVKGQVKTGKNVVLSPTVQDGEIRIVLSWGASPVDLDSHAEGRSSAGSNFHISYRNKSVNNVGTLDVDDTNGFGPETITITDPGVSFTYSVVDFLNTSSMGSSNAVVKVYVPGNPQAIVYNIPSGVGNTWEVFKYQNGEITPINSIR